MNYLFTSESVSEGHPDKVADQISDAVVDEFLARDPESKVACETLVTTGQVVIAGEVKSNAYIDLQGVARRVIDRIGYNRSELQFDAHSCGIFSAVHEQSGDINQGVERQDRELQGAGDQGMMFGYACNETPLLIPLSLALSHALVRELAEIRREGVDMTYLRPDSKSQVTVEYDENHNPVRVHTIVVSTQHDEFIRPTDGISEKEAEERMQEVIRRDVRQILIPRVRAKMPAQLRHLLDEEYILMVNPTGKFIIGGPHGDTGLTGRKIIVDTYGGHGAHGGGAFSGKDPSKVDRSAAYAARHIAKNIVAAGLADRVLVQVAYAIGEAQPVSLHIDTYGTSHIKASDTVISQRIAAMPEFDLRPYAIEQRFSLRTPIYEETAAYGHVGRIPRTAIKTFLIDGHEVQKTVHLFPWEKTDAVEALRKTFADVL
ncbi:MAG: methionine adenosyltransferase [Bacteroidales bacterium]|nr:methionine adenosyltransferase [Bacteroidales bacterium]